jgi:signal transduction histidine kinase
MHGRKPHLKIFPSSFAEIEITHELEQRGARPPNFQTEAEAMRELASSLTLSPDQILQKLSETVLKLCHAHSAGVSVFEPAQNCFRWRAIAGRLAHYLGGTAPKDFSPCGIVMDEDRPLLLNKPERFYTYVNDMNISCNEILLMPFKQNGKVAGTLWVVFHNDHRKFDCEDVRLLSSLSSFASVAVQSSQDRTNALLAHRQADSANLRLREFFMQAPTPMVILEGPEHRFTLANPPYQKLVGRPVLGKTVREAFPKEEVEHFIPILDRVFQSGQAYLSEELPLEIIDEKGRTQSRYIQVGYYPYKNSQNQVSGIFAIHYDLTDQVVSRNIIEKARRSVLNERENFRSLLRHTPELACILQGPDHIFEFVNEAHIRALGFDATGMAVREAQPDSVEAYGILDSVYNTGVTAELKEIPVTVSGRLRYFNLTFSARRDEAGKINGVMVLGIEITDQRQQREELKIAKEEAEHANTLKSSFLANMSHEIRTPLGAMIGFADLLRDPSLSPATRGNYIDILIRNGETLSVVINDILDLSKVEAGHMTLEFSKMHPIRIANEVISALRLKADEKKLDLRFTADPSTPKRFVSDSARLKQILLNLISNAIKFTQFGSVSIRSYGGVEPPGRESLYFEVTDTGIGIPENQRDKIFEMFVQADGSITRKFGGTGLGLALSRRLARALGGDVEIKNTSINKGSTFLVKVVSQEPGIEKQESFPTSEPDPPPEGNALNGVRVLVVDDALDNQDLIGYYLERHGAIVELADNGKVAIEKALANNYDVVLMDVQMPEMDGYTATQKLRESGYPTPIIALTAHAMNEARQKCMNVGCSGYLSKPINSREMISMIARHARLN